GTSEAVSSRGVICAGSRPCGVLGAKGAVPMSERVLHSAARGDTDLIPVRMCNELVYCPRLFHLEHVQGVFVHSSDTVEGLGQHERAKRRGVRLRVAASNGETQPDDGLFEQLPRRLMLSSETLGVRGEIDVVEIAEGKIVVVEAKHGKAPRHRDHQWEDHALPYRAWPADVVQVGLYMALLRDLGMPCEEARILYRGSREREVIGWSSELERF